MPTFIIGEEGVEIMEAGEVPMGVLNGVEPVLMSRKLWKGPDCHGQRRGIGCSAGR